jgi:hypothetical protein
MTKQHDQFMPRHGGLVIARCFFKTLDLCHRGEVSLDECRWWELAGWTTGTMHALSGCDNHRLSLFVRGTTGVGQPMLQRDLTKQRFDPSTPCTWEVGHTNAHHIGSGWGEGGGVGVKRAFSTRFTNYAYAH